MSAAMKLHDQHHTNGNVCYIDTFFLGCLHANHIVIQICHNFYYYHVENSKVYINVQIITFGLKFVNIVKI